MRLRLNAGTCPMMAAWMASVALALAIASSQAADTAAQLAQSDSKVAYTTNFDGDENPLSEGGRWLHHGLDWAKIHKSGGIACGTQSGTNEGAERYDDSYAHLSGFPPDQEAWGTVHIAKPDPSCHQELEILLRWTSSAHSTTGYECFARCVNDGSSYVQIVRWEGPLGKFTYLANKGGAEYGLKDGDILKASIIGNVITLYINGVEKARVKDDTYKTGNPGIGVFLQCNGRHGMGSNKDYGFKSFAARSIESADQQRSETTHQAAFPIKVSENKRYFVDQGGQPVFWLGTTQWQLFREYKLEEAKTILEKTASHGFAFVQAMLMGVGDGTKSNVYGQKPWINNDPLTPNEAYFKNIDAVLRIARENNLAISMTLYHQRYRQHITVNNARRWAQWLAERYKDTPNIVWSMTPEARQEFVPILRELAAGLRAGDGGRHLITFKPDPAPYSSSFIHAEPWLDFDSMQTWNGVRLIYPMVTRDYNLKPAKPVLMAEGAYEAGSEYGFEVTPLWVRRQAYYSYLAGAHHTYGHNDSWRVLPTWKKALDAPGAVQMGILKKSLTARSEWWLLVPDQSIFASGSRTEGDLLHLAARHQDGKWAMLYLADKASFSVNMNKIAAGKISMAWVNPKTGDVVPLGSAANTGVKTFSTPDGWEDALLVLEAYGNSRAPSTP